jgi:hypothetical protein
MEIVVDKNYLLSVYSCGQCGLFDRIAPWRKVLMRIVFACNVLCAGWIAFSALFWPVQAVTTVFSDGITYSNVIPLVGCLWMAIWVLSILGLVWPMTYYLVFVFQLIYKSLYLIAVVIPALARQMPFPIGVASFFLAWVFVLPLVIPWGLMFRTRPEFERFK